MGGSLRRCVRILVHLAVKGPSAAAFGAGLRDAGGVGAIATACTGYILRGEPFTILMGAGVEVVLAGIAIFGKGFAKDEAR